MGHDPPGVFTRFLHPRSGRHGHLPADIIPVGRSVVVPANGSLPNIVLSPRAVARIRRVLADERFDIVHLHEPMTPAICVATLATAQCPIVATWHAQGDLGWMRYGLVVWGFLDGPDRRADRGVGDGRRVGVPLAARRLPRDPERRADPGRGGPDEPRASRRLHRSSRSPERTSDAAPGLATGARRDGSEAKAHRDRSAAVPSAPHAATRRRRRHRRAGNRDERGAD